MTSSGKGRNSRKRRAIAEPVDVGLQVPGDEIAFTASLPSSDGAIKVHGDGGLRLTLDVPESQLPLALHMVKMRHTSFDVIVRPRLGTVAEADRPEHRAQD